MPSVTWPGASSSVWYQPISLARSSACTRDTLTGSTPCGGGLERPCDGLVVGVLRVARGGCEAVRAKPLAQVSILAQAPERGGQRVGGVGRSEQQAVVPVAQVLARAPGAGGDDRAADRHRLEWHEPPRLIPLNGKDE